jgi:hypothetical protein
VRLEAVVYCHCCSGGRGEAEGARGRSWRVWEEGRALRAGEGEVGVCGEVEWGVGEVGAAGEVVMEGQRLWVGREEGFGGSCWIGVLRTGRLFTCLAR